MKKSSSSKRSKKQKISTDRVQKSTFLNSVYLSVEDNKKLVNNLNNTYRYYVINSNINDLILYNNISKLGYERLSNIKKKLKNSFQSIRQFDNKYMLNIIQNNDKENKSEAINDLNNIEKDVSLNISNISKNFKKPKNKRKKQNNNPINNIVNSKERKNIPSSKNSSGYNIQCYKSKNSTEIVNRKSSINDEIFSGNDIQKITQASKKLDKLSNLYEQIVNFNKKEFFLLKDSERRKNLNYIREKFDYSKRPKSTTYRNKNILWMPKNKSIGSKSLRRPYSSVFTRTNKTTIYNKKRFKKGSSNNNILNKSDLISNSSNKKNILTRSGKQRIIDYNYSKISKTSFQNRINKRQRLSSPLISSSRNNIKYSLSKKVLETSKEIETITSNTINELNKINQILKRNYSAHKEPEIKQEIKKNIIIELIKEKSFDYKKIREELNLRDSNGLLGKINEISLLERDLKNMEHRLNKKRLEMLKPIARSTIREDRLLNKRLIYNVGIENHKYREKFFKLYNLLSYAKKRKKMIENFIIN